MAVNFSGVSRGSFVGRLARLPLRLIPRNAVLPIMQGALKGRRWVAGSSVHGCWLGSYEHEKQHLYERFVRPGMAVYDIGANVGFYTLLSAVLVGERGSVASFEPLPRNVGFLRRHVELNGLGNVTIFDAAASDRVGTTFFEEGEFHSMSKMAANGRFEVRMVTIDDLRARAQLPAPGVVKIDVEGAELMVLRGAERTLRESRPVIFLATHGAEVHRDCCELLRGLGYRLTPIDGRALEESDEVLAEPEGK